MLSFSTFAAAIALTSIGVSANPAARSTCSPTSEELQGTGIDIRSVADASLKWGDAATAPASGDILIATSFDPIGPPNFSVSQSGTVPTSYIIEDQDWAVTTSSSSNELILSAASSTGDQENQLFNIVCQSCGTSGNAGSSCTVSPEGDSNTCVQIGQANSPLEIVTCDGSNTQLFDIVVIDIFH